MPKITKRSVDALTPKGIQPSYLWDDHVAGFGVKALPSGPKKYVVKYRVGRGGRAARQRWLTLGLHGTLTCAQARDLAKQVLAEVAQGKDPQEERSKVRHANTLGDVWDRFATDYLPDRKPGTRYEYQSQWTNVIAPKFGKRPIAEISRSEVDSFHKSKRSTPYRANRVLALLSRLMNLAERWGWRDQGTNPCRFIERFREKARSRYLDEQEIQRLGQVLRESVEEGEIWPEVSHIIQLLLYTGARLNEITQAKWEWVDWHRRVLDLPDSKTGAKQVHLSEPALELLTTQKEYGRHPESLFLFPGRSPDAPVVEVRKSWRRICAKAKLCGVRLHDLRHTAASVALAQGVSLPIIGQLLGHTQAQTTLRYAHLADAPAKAAADILGEALGANLKNCVSEEESCP